MGFVDRKRNRTEKISAVTLHAFQGNFVVCGRKFCIFGNTDSGHRVPGIHSDFAIDDFDIAFAAEFNLVPAIESRAVEHGDRTVFVCRFSIFSLWRVRFWLRFRFFILLRIATD